MHPVCQKVAHPPTHPQTPENTHSCAHTYTQECSFFLADPLPALLFVHLLFFSFRKHPVDHHFNTVSSHIACCNELLLPPTCSDTHRFISAITWHALNLYLGKGMSCTLRTRAALTSRSDHTQQTGLKVCNALMT